MQPLAYTKLDDVWPQGFNAEEWLRIEQEIKEKTIDLFGSFPPERCDLKPKVLGEEKCQGYRRLHLAFMSEPDDTIYAYLLIPDSLPNQTPAVIAIHTSASAGKDCTVGKAGLKPEDLPRRHDAYALDVVEHGYVALAPDMDTIGERARDRRFWDTRHLYERHPEWSAMGKAAWDISRCVDYLETLEFVDRKRIACMGHCYGGYVSVFAAALEPRLRAVLGNSAIWTFRTGRRSWSRDPNDSEEMKSARHYYGEKAGVYVHIPKLAEYVGREMDEILKPLPIDYYQIACLIAPRGFFVSVPSSDFPSQEPIASLSHEVVSQFCSALTQLYEVLGVPDHFEAWRYESEHTFGPEAKRRAFGFLAEVL